MSNMKRNNSRCVALRTAKGTTFLGTSPVAESTTAMDKYPADCYALENLMGKSDVNEIVQMFHDLHQIRPECQQIGKRAMELTCADADVPQSHLRLHFSWQHDVLYNVLELLCKNNNKITLIGHADGHVIAADKDIVQELIKRCPDITSIRLQEFNSPDTMEYFKQLASLQSICLSNSHISRGFVCLPNLTHFSANISPSQNCSFCKKCDITHGDFFTFLNLNAQLRFINLTVNLPSNHCYRDCSIGKSDFVTRAGNIIHRIPVYSFTLYEGDERYHIATDGVNVSLNIKFVNLAKSPSAGKNAYELNAEQSKKFFGTSDNDFMRLKKSVIYDN